MVSVSVKRLFSRCRVLGSGAGRVTLAEPELFALMHLCLRDLEWEADEIELSRLPVTPPSHDYYRIPLEWFALDVQSPTSGELVEALANAIVKHQDYALYFQNLCALHKRRVKYRNILRNQPRPTMDQIGPRSLLEYGICDSQFLSSWMIWRKWIYDIDNRSAQETGYLFEPILASCLGGESIGARNSPVKRLDAFGNPTRSGRQIDCYVGVHNLAYEFKLRVTIAASGQGRFAEELSFPKECAAAGLRPVLFVLDPTPSSRLSELQNAFLRADGRIFVGEQAWQHMDDESGEIMSTFIKKYIRPPLLEMTKRDDDELMDIHLSWVDEEIVIQSSDESYKIQRASG